MSAQMNYGFGNVTGTGLDIIIYFPRLFPVPVCTVPQIDKPYFYIQMSSELVLIESETTASGAAA